MSKFCGKCGSPLNENGKCPKCDATRVSKKKGRILLLTIIAVVLLSGAITGLVYVNRKGMINLPLMQSNKSGQESGMADVNNQTTAETFSPETVYASVLKTYKDAFAGNYYVSNEYTGDAEDEYDISKISPELGRSFGGVKYPLSYCYYDISNDGVPELIICVDYGDGSGQHIVDMLGYENGKVKRLFGLWMFGARGSFSIHSDGFISFCGSGGATYSGNVYYRLDKNSAIPKTEAEINIDYSNNDTKYYLGSDDHQHEITENEYNATVSKFGEKVTLKWDKLCESKLYETEFSVRSDNGMNEGYQQIYVTGETSDEFIAVYQQIGNEGYPVYAKAGTAFRIKKNGESSAVKWTDGANNEFVGAASYNNNCFRLSFETSSTDSAITSCGGADFYFVNHSGSESQPNTSVSSSESITSESEADLTVNFTPDNLWENFVNKTWVDEEGHKIKFYKNITYYKLKPNAIHTDSDYYMGAVSTTNSKGYYYGHYHIDNDNQLRFQFNSWPDGSVGLLLYDSYVWDPTLQTKNSWCMTADGKIKFSHGDGEFSNKTFHC